MTTDQLTEATRAYCEPQQAQLFPMPAATVPAVLPWLLIPQAH